MRYEETLLHAYASEITYYFITFSSYLVLISFSIYTVSYISTKGKGSNLTSFSAAQFMKSFFYLVLGIIGHNSGIFGEMFFYIVIFYLISSGLIVVHVSKGLLELLNNNIESIQKGFINSDNQEKCKFCETDVNHKRYIENGGLCDKCNSFHDNYHEN